jgi:hypothetical protein
VNPWPFGPFWIYMERQNYENKDQKGIKLTWFQKWTQEWTQEWSESASELYRPSDRRLSASWLPTFADRRCHVVSVTDPYGRSLGFLDRSRYFSIK